jgi:hypothetical protein
MKDIALKVSGVIFFLMAIMHFLRIILSIEVTIAGIVLPIWGSAFGFVIPLLLSVWMFRSVKATK